MKYDAFISYSHHADGKLAPALQEGLRRLAKPWNRRHALRVFRDDTGLSVTPALWSSISQALNNSEYFILLASPEAAVSEWVDREVRFWLDHREAKRILPVVTGGEWRWDDAAGELSDESTAAPASLRGAFVEEPRHLDLRWAHDATTLDLRNGRFRDAIADLAAPIHGIPKDELESEDLRQHRKAIRIRRAAVTGLLALTIATTVAGMLAFISYREAEKRRRVTQAQRLATESRTFLDASQPERALVAGLHALQTTRIDDDYLTVAETRLYEALAHSTMRKFAAPWSSTRDPALSDDVLILPVTREEAPALMLSVSFDTSGCHVATGGIAGNVIIWDICRNRSLRTVVDRILETADGPEWPERISDAAGSEGSLLATAFSPDGRWIAAGGVGGLWLHDARGGRTLIGPQSIDRSATVTSLSFSPDGRRLAWGNAAGAVLAWDAADPERESVVVHRAESAITSVAFSTDGSYLASADASGGVHVWHSAGRIPEARTFLGHEGPVHSLAFVVDSHRLVTGARDGTVGVWELSQPNDKPTLLSTSDGDVTSVAASVRALAAGSRSGRIRIWNLDDLSRAPRVLVGHTRLVASVAFSPDGRRIASASYDGDVRLWSVFFEDLIDQLCKVTSGIVESEKWALAEDASLAAAGFDSTLMAANCYEPVLGNASRLAELSAVVEPQGALFDAALASYRFALSLDPTRDLEPGTARMDFDPEQVAVELSRAAAAYFEERKAGRN